jgi:hypothetical protein
MSILEMETKDKRKFLPDQQPEMSIVQVTHVSHPSIDIKKQGTAVKNIVSPSQHL